MFDHVECRYPLPDSTEKAQNALFQTKAFGDGFTGGFMDDYTITEEGTLVLHTKSYEIVPDKERPYYGKPEWDKNPLFQMIGSMKSIPEGDEVKEYHGIINIYTDIDGEWFEYEIKFTDGKVSGIKRIYREFGGKE